MPHATEDFFIHLAKHADSNNDFNIGVLMQKYDLDDLECKYHFETLLSLKYVEQLNLNDFHITPAGSNYINSIQSPSHDTPKPVKEIFKIIIEITVGVVIAYIAFRLGFN